MQWLRNLQQAYHAWKKRRYWKARQHEHLFIMLKSDNRWMASNPIAATLTQRYIDALEEDWYTKVFQPSDKIREQLGLTPNYKEDTNG